MWWEALKYYWDNGYSGRLGPNSLLQYRKSANRFDELSEKPILVGGCGRSGTTLMLAVLGAHPKIACLDFETGLFLKQKFSSNTKSNHQRNIGAIKSFLSVRGISEEAVRWCEKTPKNVRHLQKIFQDFDDQVQVILMVRDGRDTVTSVHPDHSGYFISPEEWISDTALSLHWKDNSNVHVVRYEDLILHFEKTAREICDFLKLEWDEKLLSFEKATNVQKNRAWSSGVQAIQSRSIGKWKEEKHQAIVKELLAQPKAKNLLAALDYR